MVEHIGEVADGKVHFDLGAEDFQRVRFMNVGNRTIFDCSRGREVLGDDLRFAGQKIEKVIREGAFAVVIEHN